MVSRVIRPTSRGFLHLDAHPDGCARTVGDLWTAATSRPSEAPAEGPGVEPGRKPGRVALVVGCSAGYGLATMVAGLARHGIRGVGIGLEKAPTERRTATAGWYRVAAVGRLAAAAGADVTFINADAFADETKSTVLDLFEQRYGRLDHLIYSIAAPRRTDPRTGVTYTSVVRPIGSPHRTKTVVFDEDGQASCREVEVTPATPDDIAQTVQVMGGADWTRWIDALAARGLLAPGFNTVALSYLGSELTAAIYRRGTIGAAKDDLEQTARVLDGRLRAHGDGMAMTSVNGAAVTQSSTAIPGIALYLGLLRRVLGDRLRSPIEQSVDLWDRLIGIAPAAVDELGRIRLDAWELADDVQREVAVRWVAATDETLAELADLDWFRDEVRRLYGFAVPGIDYAQPTQTDWAWPAAMPDGTARSNGPAADPA